LPDIKAIQAELRAAKLDGWLFYDFRHRDPIAHRILGVSESAMATRRWFYLIPARGMPRKLVHRIESAVLDSLPGQKLLYARQEELKKNLLRLLRGMKALAMQYSPRNAIPYVSMVDAGTVELVRSAGSKVVSSADLVQKFEACWTPEQLELHLEAGKAIDRITQEAFAQAAGAVRNASSLTEYDLREWVLGQFRANGVITDEPPIVAVGAHTGDPHYEPKAGDSATIHAGDILLLDIWGKKQSPGSVYYDVTWMGFLGESVPEKYAKVFSIVREARDRVVAFVRDALRAGRTIQGWQVDRVARELIRKAGYGKYFVHRTGHSIGQEVHGNGVNLDGLETQDVRRIIPCVCFSVEPGIYLPEFGIRSEVNVYVEEQEARVTGAVQEEILPLLSR
jgi:Xaa-Pro aminopeptidase